MHENCLPLTPAPAHEVGILPAATPAVPHPLTKSSAPEPAEATAEGKARRGPRTPLPVPEPLVVGADQAGPMCGRSPASWWRDHAAGRCPKPLKLGGRTLWRTAELRRWVEAGCPDRRGWEAQEKARKGGR